MLRKGDDGTEEQARDAKGRRRVGSSLVREEEKVVMDTGRKNKRYAKLRARLQATGKRRLGGIRGGGEGKRNETKQPEPKRRENEKAKVKTNETKRLPYFPGQRLTNPSIDADPDPDPDPDPEAPLSGLSTSVSCRPS